MWMSISAEVSRTSRVSSFNEEEDKLNSSSPTSTLGKTRFPSVHQQSPVSDPLNEHKHFCPNCIHCQQSQLVEKKVIEVVQPVWFHEAPKSSHVSVIMDDFDEDAFRKIRLSKDGYACSGYSYGSSLRTRGRPNTPNSTVRYERLPFVNQSFHLSKPTHTPFVNYDQLLAFDHLPNKPYSQTLFLK